MSSGLGPMADWSDPRIVVAIVTGLIGFFTGLGSIGFSWHVFNKQRSQTRNQNVWEEYKETIYDPIRSALADVERYAKIHLGTYSFPRDKEKRGEAFRGLNERLNTVEMSCAKADKHPRTVDTSWEDGAEQENLKLHGLIQKHELIEVDELSLKSKLPELEKALYSYINIFEARLLEQREKMLGILKCATTRG